MSAGKSIPTPRGVEERKAGGACRPGGGVATRLAVVALTTAVGSALLAAQEPAAGAGGSAAALLPVWAYLVTFFGLLAGSGMISAAETALFSLDKLDLNQLRSRAAWGDRFILRLLDNSKDTLVTMMIVNNIVNISISLTASALTARVVGGRTEWYVIPMATAIAGGGILMFGEIMPKMLAHSHPQAFSRALAPPVVVMDYVLMPLRKSISLIISAIFRVLGIEEETAASQVTEEELKVMINSGEVGQVLEDDEREMIDGVFELRRTTVSEILTPRMAVVAVQDDLEQEAMLQRLREVTVSRVIVVHESLDHMVGFLLAKEVLLNPREPWRKHLREPLMVPEGLGLLDLLQNFRSQRTKMAVVVDEYGGVAGIVTLQDVLEEIVGDMYEKHELQSEEIQALGPGEWRAAGSVHLAELGDALEVEFPEHKGRTLGGFIMNTLGRIPKVGDEVAHEALTLKVETMIARRVNTVLLRRELPVAAQAENGGEA